MIIYNCEQRSVVWMRARCGKITASNADRLLTKAKIETFKWDVLAEVITGLLKETFVSAPMQWGIDNEDLAAAWYIKETGNKVTKIGFGQSQEFYIAGCSPDLLVGDDGLAEIKCRNTNNHLRQWVEGPDKDDIAQLQYQMFVSGRKWCDYVIFDPRLTDKKLKGKIHKIERDDKFIGKLKEGVIEIQSFVDNFLLDNGVKAFEHIPEELTHEYSERFINV